MGTDLQGLYDSDQPMADIFVQSFGQKATLGIWAIVVIVQYMMGSSMLLSASRQTFAFSRDGGTFIPSVSSVCVLLISVCLALPFSGWVYRMNKFTGTPVNSVWYCSVLSILMAVLVFAGDQAINAVFAISVSALYIAYAVPIVARFVGDNDFKPGPFDLGAFVSFYFHSLSCHLCST